MLIGQALLETSFHSVEALACSSARQALNIGERFRDDTLDYFIGRWTPVVLAKPLFRRYSAPSATRPSMTAPPSAWPSTTPLITGASVSGAPRADPIGTSRRRSPTGATIE